jgi:signal transduction histidine kinase
VFSTDLALQRAADAIDSLDDAFTAVDHGWRIVLVNRKQESLFRRPRNETVGRVLWDVFPEATPWGDVLSEIRRSAKERAVVEFEQYCGPLDLWLEGRVCPHDQGLDIYLRDVTARRRSDEERPATRRRDEVLGIVAHDLRNHLNTIRASSKVALVMGDRSPRRPVETIVRASERMERLIGDLLDVTAIECGTLAIDPAPASAFELVSEALDAHTAVGSQAGVDLTAECEKELPCIAADSQRLVQVLGNLIGNAMKFTPRGGQIVVGAVREDDQVRFWVADTGQGIPLDQLPHIFTKFRMRRARPQEGVGLGLAICKAIVDAHGGRIWAESHADAGTTVSFTMPIDVTHDTESTRIIPPAPKRRERGASEKSC